MRKLRGAVQWALALTAVGLIACSASTRSLLLAAAPPGGPHFRMPVPFVACDASCPTGQMCIEPTAERGRRPECFPVVAPESLADRRYWHRPLVVKRPRFLLRESLILQLLPRRDAPAVMLAVRDGQFSLRVRSDADSKSFGDVIVSRSKEFPGSSSEYILGIARDRAPQGASSFTPEFELLGFESQVVAAFPPDSTVRGFIYWDTKSPMNEAAAAERRRSPLGPQQ